MIRNNTQKLVITWTLLSTNNFPSLPSNAKNAEKRINNSPGPIGPILNDVKGVKKKPASKSLVVTIFVW